MEHDVVLTDEVYKACVLALPPLFPSAVFLRLLVAQLLCVRNVADRCIEPHIEHLAVGTFNRHGDTPVEVTCHGAWLQVHVEPALALTVYIWAPLLVVLQNPLLEPLLVVVEWQVPVLCLLQDRCLAGLL